jgi:hypothetical protein
MDTVATNFQSLRLILGTDSNLKIYPNWEIENYRRILVGVQESRNLTVSESDKPKFDINDETYVNGLYKIFSNKLKKLSDADFDSIIKNRLGIVSKEGTKITKSNFQAIPKIRDQFKIVLTAIKDKYPNRMPLLVSTLLDESEVSGMNNFFYFTLVSDEMLLKRGTPVLQAKTQEPESIKKNVSRSKTSKEEEPESEKITIISPKARISRVKTSKEEEPEPENSNKAKRTILRTKASKEEEPEPEKITIISPKARKTIISRTKKEVPLESDSDEEESVKKRSIISPKARKRTETIE